MEPYLSMVFLWACNFNPRGYAECAGALLPISQNSALFSLLGTMYGGDGRTTFGLPDLRGKVPMGQGQHPGSSFSYRQGQIGGAEFVTLSVSEMPTHNHTATFTGSAFTASASIAAIDNVNGTTSTPSGGVHFAVGKVGSGFTAQDANIYAAGTPNTQVGSNIPISGVSSGTVAVGLTGGGQSHENRMPFQILRYCIATVGLFTSRN